MIKYFHIVLDYVIMYYDYIGVCVIILGIRILFLNIFLFRAGGYIGI